MPLQVSEHYWAVLLFHSVGLALVHMDEWEKVRGRKVIERVGQKSNLGESWTEVELRFRTYNIHHGQEKLCKKLRQGEWKEETLQWRISNIISERYGLTKEIIPCALLRVSNVLL